MGSPAVYGGEDVTPRDAARELVGFLQRRAGRALRGVVFYGPDEYEVLYLRDDVKRKRLRRDVDEMIGRLRNESRDQEETVFPFGDLQATVRLFDDAVLMHLPQTESQGTMVGLEPDAARQLSAFVGECVARVGQGPE